MKDSSKETLNELIRRERESEVGPPITDTDIKNMIKDIQFHVWWSRWGVVIGSLIGTIITLIISDFFS